MRIAVFGGDGFIGWPTSLHLSSEGHDIAIVDDLSRRRIDDELSVQSLTPIKSIEERLNVWDEISNQSIDYLDIDIAEDYEGVRDWLASWRPDALVHLAQQRAAPYSMKSPGHKNYTVQNNVNATHNLLNAIVEIGLDTHIVHLGTMGVYGYNTIGATIPEGYLSVLVNKDDGTQHEEEILYPANPGSVYHMTKCLDQIMFVFYANNDHLRITDLHQGIVWGTQTEQTRLDERLINRFDYDGDYGTVLNRFLIQAAIDHPLTVHGSGGQTRAFIHIQDSVRCIALAIANPPLNGDRTKIFNQMTEVHKIRDLAELISSMSGIGIEYVVNPRREADENELQVSNDQFMQLGLNPTTLEVGMLEELVDIAQKYRKRIDRTRIPAMSAWTREIDRQLHACEDTQRLHSAS